MIKRDVYGLRLFQKAVFETTALGLDLGLGSASKLENVHFPYGDSIMLDEAIVSRRSSHDFEKGLYASLLVYCKRRPVTNEQQCAHLNQNKDYNVVKDKYIYLKIFTVICNMY